MTEKERMLAGKIYCPFKVGGQYMGEKPEVLEQFNSMPWQKEKERMELLRSIFGHLEDVAVIVPPFYCDKGTQIYVGKHFMQIPACSYWTRLTCGSVIMYLSLPVVCIYTAGHPIDADIRRMESGVCKGCDYRR